MLGDIDNAGPPAGDPGVGFDIRRYISGFGAQLAGPANVIMQLSRPGVGYGVKESPVESGNILEHPVKRARTTFTYLAVALLGSEEDRLVYRKAVNRQHAQVRSTRSSPVEYNAMDPELQLWVAACLYHGTVDLVERMQGPLDPTVADQLYAHCARFGTTLQVKKHMWPADRLQFARYWDTSLAEVRIDDTIREYLLALARLEHLPGVVRVPLGQTCLFWTRGFLPPLLREQMGFEWSPGEESEFNRRLRLLGSVESLLPPAARALPFDVLLWDMRRRRRSGRPLV